MSHAVAIIRFLLFQKKLLLCMIFPPGKDAEINVSILVSIMKSIFPLSLENLTFLHHISSIFSHCLIYILLSFS